MAPRTDTTTAPARAAGDGGTGRRAPTLLLLGPVAAAGEDGLLDIGSPRHREMLAALAVDAGRVVRAETLLERVWGERARGGTMANLQAVISRLRARLRSGDTGLEIDTVPPGYRLVVPTGAIDADRFLADVAAADDAKAAGDLGLARTRLLHALRWWRGDALADIAQPFARAEATRLDGLRLSVEQQLAELDVEMGEPESAVERLRRLAGEHPMRESVRGQLMRALYLSGRQADALAEYADLRDVLVDELGIDPGPAVQRLHTQILQQDSDLGTSTPVGTASPRRTSGDQGLRGAGHPRGDGAGRLVGPESRPGATARGMLPSEALLGELVGRERDIERLVGLLRAPTSRLVTLTGVGGCGKSRLAVAAAAAAADHFPDGITVVPLAPLADVGAVLPEIARAVGVAEGADPLAALVDALRDRRRLLLLDNAEHLLDAGPELATLVAACPDLRVLVTSRIPLHVRGEALVPVAPLDVDAAAELFVARARARQPLRPVHPEDAAVRALVSRLAGIPLAVELAAARARLLTPAAMLERLDDVLAAEGARDLPPRQRTMASTLDWSFRLLSELEQACFPRLAVFADGFSWDAAVAVLADLADEDETFRVLESLVEQSLVVAEAADPAAGADASLRFRLLEPVSQYAATRLGEAEERLARNAHLGHYGALAERTEPAFRGPGTMAALELVAREHANVVRAIEWGARHGRVDAAGWLCWHVYLFWWLRGALREGRRLVSLVLANGPDDAVRPRLLAVLGAMAFAQGDLTAAAAWHDGAALARRTGDQEALAHCVAGSGLLALAGEDLRGAIDAYRRVIGLTEQVGLRGEWLWTVAHVWCGTAHLALGDLATAATDVERGLAAARRRRDPLGTYTALFSAVQIDLARGEHERARDQVEEGLRLSLETGDRANLASFLDAMALVDSTTGAPGRVGVLRGAASTLRTAVGADAFGYYRPDEAQIAEAERTARAVRGALRYAADVARGCGMTPEQVVAYAVRKGPHPAGG